jgi:hypothetical protein
VFSTAFRWHILVGLFVLVNVGGGMLVKQVAGPVAEGDFMFNLAGVLMLALYAVLLAIPFFPGIEIGLSLLIAHGSAAALPVYAATICGLLIAYGIGVLLSDKVSCKFMMKLGLTRACLFVDEIKLMNREQRLHRLQQALPEWAGRWFLGHRSIVLALLLNLPGNSLIGGGGGIAMLAGLSRTFSTMQFVLTIALATLPVPLSFLFFEGGLLAW